MGGEEGQAGVSFAWSGLVLLTRKWVDLLCDMVPVLPTTLTMYGAILTFLKGTLVIVSLEQLCCVLLMS